MRGYRSGYRLGAAFAFILCLGAAGFAADRMPAPVPARLALFDSLDDNGDGVLTDAECSHAPELRLLCSTADGNRDGVVDATEFAALEHRARAPLPLQPYVVRPQLPEDAHTTAI